MNRRKGVKKYMNQKREKGFTLIELLAVIVILAIIALIAVPVIMNIINKANKSAFKDTAYGVISAGELYFAERQLEPNGMLEDVTIKLPDSTNTLGLKGEVPEGSIVISKEGKTAIAVQNGRYCITKGFDDADVTVADNYEECKNPGEPEPIMTSENACVTSGTCSQSDILAGIKVNVKVNDSKNYFFYVIADNGTELTLIMNRNLGDNIEWYAAAGDNSKGPTTALAELALRTSDWTNIPEKTYTVSGIGSDGTTRKYEDKTVTGRARLITYAEANNILTANNWTMPTWMYANLYNTGSNTDSVGNGKYGYWTSTADAYGTYNAWNVTSSGNFDYESGTDDPYYGLRPVITISK